MRISVAAFVVALSVTVAFMAPARAATSLRARDVGSPPSLSIGDAQVTEGNGGIGSAGAVFTVTLSEVSSQTVSVDCSVADGTATAGQDYETVAGTLSFPAGATSETFTVPVDGDTIHEPNETFIASLTDPVNATILSAHGIGTIVDDDPIGTFSVGDATVTEGNTGTSNAVFTITLSNAMSQAVSVNYATADGTAVAGSDYTMTMGTATFAPGETVKTVNVPVIGDTLFEANETFSLDLSGPTGTTIAGAHGVGTIVNDDPPPSLSIFDISAPEGNSTSTATFTVSLSAPSYQTVTVNYSTVSGTALSGLDFAPSGGTLSFAPGETTKVIAVSIVGDTLNEANETFTMNLTGPVHATLANAQAHCTIVDDDPPPSISVSDASVVEGNFGTSTAANFTVSLSAPSGRPITVQFATASGSASIGSDLYFNAGTVTFAPGQTQNGFSVGVIGDNVHEGNETFIVNLSSPTNAVLGRAQGFGTIVDDDSLPVLSVNDSSVVEGNSGTSNMIFTVGLSSPMAGTVMVNYATTDGTASSIGNFFNPGDYQATTGSLTFAPGQTIATFAVPVNGDTTVEPDETFFVNLSNAGVPFGRSQATGTIYNDDSVSPVISVQNVAVPEGDSGNTNAMFTVSLSLAGTVPITVHYATGGGTATVGADYIATSGTLTFAPGEVAKTVSVPIVGDILNESDETLDLVLSNANNALISGGTAIGTINDDDAPPSLSIDDKSAPEGDAGTHNMVFDVSLSAASGQTVTVNYVTADGTAQGGIDYASEAGSLSFAPGEVTKTITVPIQGDTVFEADETFKVVLSGAAQATIADGEGVGTIVNDDPVPSLSVSNIALNEGNNGTANAVFSIVLSAPSSQDIAVQCDTVDGTATAGSDYVARSAIVTIPAGQTSADFAVATDGDTVVEPDETFSLNLSAPINATVATPQAICTILNDDGVGPVVVNRWAWFPIKNATLNGLHLLQVFLNDSDGNHGVAGVNFFLLRNADSMWWSGKSWVASSTPLSAVETSPGAWSRSDGLPSSTVTDPATKLADGIYTFYIQTTDINGKQTTFSSLFQQLTPVKVSATITIPRKNSTINGLPGLRATTVDSLGGGGVASLDFLLLRNADSMWWNGTSWGSAATALPAVQSPTGTWTKTGGLPSPTSTDPTKKLTDGIYTVYARPTDIHGVVSTFSSLFLQQTPIKVSATVTVPKRNSTVNGLTGFQVKTSDSLGGSGVKSLDVYLLRNVDSMWWNGTSWGGSATALPCVQSPTGTWTKTGGLPSPTSTDPAKKLTDGIYTVYARPTDIHGVVSTFSSLFQQQTPIKVSAVIASPAHNATVSSLTAVSVTTTDNVGGKGVASVACALRRSADGLWWNGMSWQGETKLLPCATGEHLPWTLLGTLPMSNTGDRTTMLTDGGYTVYAQATDIHGGLTTVSSSFMVKSGANQPALQSIMAMPRFMPMAPSNFVSGFSDWKGTGYFIYRGTQSDFPLDPSHLIAFQSADMPSFSDSWSASPSLFNVQIVESSDGSGVPVVTSSQTAPGAGNPAMPQLTGNGLTISGTFLYDPPVAGTQYFYRAMRVLSNAANKLETEFSAPSGGATPLTQPAITGASGTLDALTLTATVVAPGTGSSSTAAPAEPDQLVVQVFPDISDPSTRFEQVFSLPGKLAPSDTNTTGVTPVASDGSVNVQLIGLLLPAVQSVRESARIGVRNSKDDPGCAPDSLTNENFLFSPNFTITFDTVSNSAVMAAGKSVGAVSTAALSSAAADAASNSLRLTFNQGIGSLTAIDPSRYSVRVDGTAAAVSSVELGRAATEVTLALPPGVLKTGALAKVAYRLIDARGCPLNGQANAVSR